jgi:hypothetical protein
MTKLSSSDRRLLKDTSFAEPGKRKYPIPDASHARNALARVSGNGTPTEKAMVRAEVKRRFPGIGKKG